MIKDSARAKQLGIADADAVLKQWGYVKLGSHTGDVEHEAVTAVIDLQPIHDEAAGQAHANTLHTHACAHTLLEHVGREASQPPLNRWYRREPQQYEIASEHDQHAEAEQIFECFDEP